MSRGAPISNYNLVCRRGISDFFFTENQFSSWNQTQAKFVKIMILNWHKLCQKRHTWICGQCISFLMFELKEMCFILSLFQILWIVWGSPIKLLQFSPDLNPRGSYSNSYENDRQQYLCFGHEGLICNLELLFHIKLQQFSAFFYLWFFGGHNSPTSRSTFACSFVRSQKLY